VRRRADGFSLVELLAALSLTGLLATAMIGTAVAQMRLARAIGLRAGSMDAARTAAWVLTGETRRLHPVDIRAIARDSIALRVFRGRGIICDRTGGDLMVRYTGDRLPDARKDSLVVITPAGEAAAALYAVRSLTSGCTLAAGEQLLQLTTDDTPGIALALVFESGSYYFSGKALRYRVGGEGRQPLTAEVLGGTPLGFTSIDSSSIRFTIVPDGMPMRTVNVFFPAHE
jgi:prepilin-type N-terminal cleavage/methylation domain-containing protein